MQTQEAGALAQQVIQIAADTVDIPGTGYRWIRSSRPISDSTVFT